MGEARVQAVRLTVMDSARAPLAGELRVLDLSATGRARRAAARLGMTWGAAVFCVFIPLLHFVLVPSLLLLGPFVAWQTWRATVLLVAGTVTCPKCQAQAALEEGTAGWPARLHCGHCGTTFDAAPVA